MKNDQMRARALVALMETDTVREAAAQSGISERTIYRYMREDREFAVAYKTLREQAAIRAAEAMEERREKAFSVLAGIMADPKQAAAARVNAAKAILDAAAAAAGRADDIARKYVSDTDPLAWHG